PPPMQSMEDDTNAYRNKPSLGMMIDQQQQQQQSHHPPLLPSSASSGTYDDMLVPLGDFGPFVDDDRDCV
ncbi:unnamed protein product, partial [Rotaria sp. Silwood1]